ncbi:phospholipase A2 inhibitor NAI-like [Caretta caretta]|uniref:phospholipase A2 inhibitor NAI-like n=1 Tax=Caretta caretta TaxID=8467 RepID=UPI003F4C8664
MEASLAACIPTALLATGACLQCEVCFGLGTSCTGDLEACAAGEDSCGIAVTASTVGRLGFAQGPIWRTCSEGIPWIKPRIKNQSILQGCMPSSQCKASPFSVNFGTGMRTQTSFACCLGEACKTATVTVPPADPKPNGRRCPASFAVVADQCSEKTIQWKSGADGNEGLRFRVHLRPATSGFVDLRRHQCKSNQGQMHSGLLLLQLLS